MKKKKSQKQKQIFSNKVNENKNTAKEKNNDEKATLVKKIGFEKGEEVEDLINVKA